MRIVTDYKHAQQIIAEQDKRIAELEAGGKYLVAEVKDAWDRGRISVDTFHAALSLDKALKEQVDG